MVPRSAPPETRLGTICNTAGGRPFDRTDTVLSSTPIPLAVKPPMSSIGILPRPGGATIAYHRLAGSAPGVVFLGGGRSDNNGSQTVVFLGFFPRRGPGLPRLGYFRPRASSRRDGPRTNCGR